MLIRAYLDITAPSYQTVPHFIVRDVASGCAYPAAYATKYAADYRQPALPPARGWIALNMRPMTFTPLLIYRNTVMGVPHRQIKCRGGGRRSIVSGTNPNASYTTANVPAGLPATLAAAGEVMRIRVRVPTTPPTPCTNGCSRSGDEQMRYMSLSFLTPGGTTIASVADSAFTKDPKGYATLIVGTGASIPSWITPANGYTFLDLTALSGYQQLSLLDLRHMIPSGGFNCAVSLFHMGPLRRPQPAA